MNDCVNPGFPMPSYAPHVIVVVILIMVGFVWPDGLAALVELTEAVTMMLVAAALVCVLGLPRRQPPAITG